MAAPRPALNPATHSVGFTAKLATVRSVSGDGKTAVCVDRQNVQVSVPMLVQRSKGPLPEPGETWLLTQDLGMWLFAAIVATSSGQFIGSEGSSLGGTRVTVSPTAPASPATGDIWVNGASGNAVFWWNGTSWISAQFGTQAIADGAITRAKVARGSLTTSELDPHAGITAGQVAFSVTEIGGVRIFTGTSQPPDPVQGDLWINPGQDNALYFWDGGRWTGLLFGAGAIQAASLTTFHLTPDAGITDGQVDFTARDIGGVTTSVSSVQPSGPAVGDLWFDGTSSYVLRQWDGAAWAPYQFGTQAIQALSVTAALIAANTITAAQIAAGTITATQIAAGTILASNIAAGTITATQIAAGSLTASVIGNLGACLNANPFFAGGSSAGWNIGGAGNTVAIVPASSLTAPPFPGYGAQVTFVTAGSAGDKFNGGTDKFGVIVGSRYSDFAWVYSSNAVTVNFGLEFRNSSGTIIVGLSTSAFAVPSNTWTLVSTIQTAPATAATGGVTMWTSAATVLSVQAAQAFPQIPGIVDATTITGAQLIATGTGGQVLAYSGTPALGNIIAAINSQASFTDPQGNVIGVGIFSYSSASEFAALQGGDILIQDGSFPWSISVDNATQSVLISLPHTGQGLLIGPVGLTPVGGTGTLGIESAVTLTSVSAPATPGSGLMNLWADNNGTVLKYSGPDGSVQAFGHRTITFSSTQTVSSSSFVTVNDGTNNFSANVSAAHYKFRIRIIYLASGTSGTPSFEITSPAFSSGGAVLTLQYNGISSGFARYDNTSGFGAAWASVSNVTVGTSTYVVVDIEGGAIFTATGTIVCRANTGAGGSSFVIQQGSSFETWPV